MILCRGSQKGECIMFFNKKSRTERFMEGFGNFCDTLAEAGNQYLEQKRREEQKAREEYARRRTERAVRKFCESIFEESENRRACKFKGFYRSVDTRPKGVYNSNIMTLVKDYVESGDPEFLVESSKRLNAFYGGIAPSITASKLENAFKCALCRSGYTWRVYSSLSSKFKVSIGNRMISFGMDADGRIYEVEAC